MKKRIGIGIFSALCCALALSFSISANAQDTHNPPAQGGSSDQSNSVPVIHATSRLVLLDVIVTDRNGKFMPGLKASDFTVLEDNKPQKISAFGVQTPPPAPKSYPPLNLPPHQYSNFTYVKPVADRPVTVVLMDMLNTTGMDQSYARKQMIKFLEKLPSGQPVALFALTSKLRMIQGFSGDSDTLVAAAKALQGHESLLLSPEAQQQHDENLATAIENTASPSSKGPNPSLSTMPMAPVGQALRDAIAAQDSFQKLERMNLTLSALDALAHAVAGYPGRKNLIWLSAEFPVVFGPGLTPYNAVINMQTGTTHTNDQLRDLENDTPPLQQTAALLAAVRLAIYPIDVRGQVSLGTGIDISAQTAYLGTVDIQNEAASTSLRQTTALWDTHEAMTDIARETGGRAFYGTNDLNDAMSRSVQQGSSYYTLAYTPTNREWKGKYRKIEVKATTPGVELTYRRGYYALKERIMRADRAKVEMSTALQPSVPESTGLVLKVQVLPPDAEHKAVRIDYAVDPRDIAFNDSVDQRKQGSIGFAAVAWDKDFKLAGQVVETKDTNFPPEAYQQLLRSYLSFHQELELKPGTYTLRLGVLDLTSHRIGSVGVPITIPERGDQRTAKTSQ